MNHALRRRQTNYLTDPFLKELDRAKSQLLSRYPGRVSNRGDKIEISPNLQTEQTIIWLEHLRRVYIEEHHAHVIEDVLFNQKGIL